MGNILTHYWGSHFKSVRQASDMELQYEVLVHRGWACNLVLEREPENQDWLSGFRRLGVRITCLPRPRGNFDHRNIIAIRRLCLETRCNAFHCDNMHMSALIGAALAGVPVRIWQKHSMNSHFEECREEGLRERIALTTRLSAKLASRVIAVSGAVGEELLGLGIPSDKVIILNNPKPEIKQAYTPREKTRRLLGFQDDSLVFVNIGRAEKVKGWDVLLKAFAKVTAVDQRSRLLLVGAKDVRGNTAFTAILEDLIQRLDIADRVSFTGHVTDAIGMLQAGDVFVLPSRSEGCCLALLEALELSLPCIATRVGNAMQVLQGGEAGILVARNDVDDLATAMISMINDGQMRAAMASRARIPDLVPSRHQHAQTMADLYECLADGSSVSDRL